MRNLISFLIRIDLFLTLLKGPLNRWSWSVMYTKTPVSAIHLTVRDLRNVGNASSFLLKLKALFSKLNI
jgi:hypothetical protein